MSFLGVGAPEAILVGIVALVVFGPKGLAEVRQHVQVTQ
jgi:Sec-independent protein translocase protein TatA